MIQFCLYQSNCLYCKPRYYGYIYIFQEPAPYIASVSQEQEKNLHNCRLAIWYCVSYALVLYKVLKSIVLRYILLIHQTNMVCEVLVSFSSVDCEYHIKKEIPIKEKKNQHQAIWREFEFVGRTLFKNPLGAGWSLLPTLWWVGSCL